ncbi:MAG: TlpA family protein disulfide reductase [Sphingobacteriaceae bacterium]|nr:TlpA family protein disulfide reductase [Sphingobacteriaceae bacterium]
MKKYLLLSLLSIITLFSSAQTIINSPVYSATNVGKLDIEKVVLTDTTTVIFFTSTFDSNFRIALDSYITEDRSSEKLMLKSASGIELNKFVKPLDGKTFSLSFPAVKKSSTSIDFVESDCENCFKIIGISLDTNKKKPVEHPVYSGNWYKTDGSKKWILGLYDTIAVYQNQIWKYSLAGDSSKAVIKLSRPGSNRTLYAKPSADKSRYMFGEQPDMMSLLSKRNNLPLNASFDNDFVKPILKRDSAVYKGFFKAYSPKLGFKTGQVFVNNNITGKQESYLIKVSPDGSFSSKFPMYYPEELYVEFPGMFFAVHCAPGKELFHFIDLGRQKQGQEFMGDLALLNEELKSTKNITRTDYSKMYTEINGFTTAQYSQYIRDAEARQMKALQDYQQKRGLSKKAFQIRSREIQLGAASDLFEYNWRMESAYRQVNKVDEKMRKPMVKSVLLDSAYLSYLRNMDLNDELNLVAANYNSLINRFRFAEAFRDTTVSYSFASITGNLRKYGLKFSAEDEKVIREVLALKKPLSKDTIELKRFAEEQKKLTSPFYEKHDAAISKIMGGLYNKNVYTNMYRIADLKPGIFIDLIRAQDEISTLKRAYRPLTNIDLVKLKAELSTPIIYKAIASENNEVVQTIAKNKIRPAGYNAAPKIEGENVFNAIMKKYAGKVVYVDFWATWCAPCRSGIERIAPLKEELNKDDVVFVYITNPTSPLETYKSMIPGIKGEHYRVTKDEWNFLSEKFKISGIPHYVLVDKKGVVADGNLDHMDNSGIKKRLLALSDKSGTK